MRRQQKELLNNLTIVVVSVMFALVAIVVSNPISFKTTDDTQLLYDRARTQVKGAFSENKLCPQNKPIAGWIDFQGNKKIVENLPDDQQASACFETVEKANQEGFIQE